MAIISDLADLLNEWFRRNRSSSDQDKHFTSSDNTHSSIELIRIIDRTIHVSPVDREKEVDYTVRNVSDEELNFVFLPLKEFALNFKVFDETGERLNYYPNHEVEQMKEEMKTDDIEAYKEFEHRFEGNEYELFVELPSENPIGSGELRTIQLTFEENDPVEFYSIRDPSIHRGWWKHWERKFFNIPSFLINAERFPEHPHDQFSVVVGTPGYTAVGESVVEGNAPEEELYENGLNEDSRVLQIRLPPAKSCKYEYDLHYDLTPNQESLMWYLAVYWMVALLAGIISILLNAFAPSFLGDIAMVKPFGQAMSGGIVTATIGIIFALNENWADRYRVLSVLILIVHSVAWFVWTIVPQTPN